MSELLSSSSLWQKQKKVYEELGVESFAPDAVPFQITNNARIAAQYASIAIEAFGKNPFTILELGAGSGRFAYLLLNELEERGANFRYLLTDIAAKNVLFWQQHPLFQSWLSQGILKCFVYDPLIDSPPEEKIDLGIANYFCDSILQDVFRVEKGKLFEGRWAEGETRYTFSPALENPYPDCVDAMKVLEAYCTSFANTSFLFPIGALRVIQSFPGTYFLIADRGDKKFAKQPLFAKWHGEAFSFAVNFDAIRRFVECRGGETLFAASSSHFVVALLSKGTIPISIRNKCEKLRFSPLKAKALTLSDLLTRLCEAHWDPILFFSFFDRIVSFYPTAKESEKKRLVQGIGQVKKRIFPIFRQEGVLLDRLNLFLHSLGESPTYSATLFQHLPLYRAIGSRLQSKWLGEVLQIGVSPPFFRETIVSCKYSRYETVSWKDSLQQLGEFDTIFFFPPPFEREPRNIPSLVQEINDKFPFLEKMVYSDQDIEAFFASMGSKVEREQIVHFFTELARKGNVTGQQLNFVMKRLKMGEALLDKKEECPFFEILQSCMKAHLKKGGAFYGCFFGLHPSDDPRVMEEYILNPFIHFEEKEDGDEIWIIIQRESGEYAIPAKDP